MIIKENIAELTRREQRLFGLDGNLATIGELRCSEILAALCAERNRLIADRKDLKSHPASFAYDAPIRKLEHNIEIATNVGGIILVHETEQYLSSDRPPERQR